MRRTLIFLALCMSLHAAGQMRVCIGGDLDHLSASDQHACDGKVRLVSEAAVEANVPEDWHLVVVCNEDGWKDYAAFTGRSETELNATLVDTDLATKTIFLRGTALTSSSAISSLVARSIPGAART